MMTDLQREALAVLSELLALSPDVRLGQLLSHVGFLGECYVDKGLGTIEDDELLAILYRHRAELEARRTGLPELLPRPGEGTSVSGSSTVPGATAPTEAIR